MHVAPQQIGQHAALLDLALDSLGREAHANSDCLALAKLVLEDAQGLVERIDQEIGNAIADGLLLRGAVRRCNQRSGPGNVGRYNQRTALAIELSRIEKSSAEAGLRISKRGLQQARVGSRYEFNKLESGRGLRFERQGLCSPWSVCRDPQQTIPPAGSRQSRLRTKNTNSPGLAV